MTDFFSENKALIGEFIRLSSEAGKRADYVQGGGGNTSAKTDDGHMLIKASGYFLSDVGETSAYAVLDSGRIDRFFKGNTPDTFADPEKEGSALVKSSALAIDGLPPLRPSVEAGFHSVLDKFVLHTHSVYANLAGCCTDCRDIMAMALDGADYTWGLVEYTNPGSMLTFAILSEIDRVQKATGKRPAAILMKNHGLIVHGPSADYCLKVHADANDRIARVFGLTGESFPPVELSLKDGIYETETPWLAEKLASGRYDDAFFRDKPLFPDEIVYLRGTFSTQGGDPAPDCACADPSTGRIRLGMSRRNAQAVAETVAATVYVADNIAASGRTLSSMGKAGREFIENWESEKYRKNLNK